MQRLTDEQRELIQGDFPEENTPECRAGRRPVPTREALDAVLWILNTVAQRHTLPQCDRNDETVHRRFQRGANRRGCGRT
ncbi:MAG: transposase [Burkholderiaceae bacterium]|nr:transposase [Burkholderiaceae bacterium]